MAESRPCPKCGAPLADDSLTGLCPRCVFKTTLDPAAGNAGFSAAPIATIRYFGDYELLEEIAHGGMGVVYKARQVSLNRTVAVKMLLAGPFASTQFVQRFHAEAEAAANLQHPNIVAIHEVGEHGSQHYFAMDYVEGCDLAALTRARPLSSTKAARYVRTMAEAIHYAHGRGTLHRDLKPSNVLIDQFDQPRITDFGLAKQLHEESGLTLSGQLLGSPGYMAPEQASGPRHRVGVGADIYSLGAILYHLVTGRAPFWAETVEETFTQLLNHEPVSPRALNPGVPRDLETICLKCLEKDPQRRYPSAWELAEDLERFLRMIPIRARPVGPAGQFWRWCRRNRAIAALTAAMVLVVLLGFAGVSWQWQRAESHAHRESRQRHRAETVLEQLELKRAEDLLQNGQASAGLAYLARVLRKNPTNDAAALRIISSLIQRSFALPLVPPLVHEGAVTWVEFSPDGTRLATASLDGTARLWDAATGQPISEPLTHNGSVRVARFSPDGTKLATAGADKTVRLRDHRTGQSIGPTLEHDSEVTSVEFSPNGKRLLSISTDGKVRVWDIERGQTIGSAIAHRGRVTAAHFSGDGGRLVTATSIGVARVWDALTGTPITPEFKEDAGIQSARFSPDNRLIATAGNDRVTFWDATTGRPTDQPLSHAGVVNDVIFSPDGALIATIGRDGTARIWDAQSLKLRLGPLKHRTWLTSGQFSPDGLRLLTVCSDNTVHLWDLLTGEALTEPILPGATVHQAGFDPNGQKIITASQNNVAQIWDIRPGQSRPRIFNHGAAIRAVRFAPDGARWLAAGNDGAVSIWEAGAGASSKIRVEHKGVVLSARFSPDGQRVLTGSIDNTAALWEARTGNNLLRLTNHTARVEWAEFISDGNRVVTASFDGTARVWETKSGRELFGPLRHKSRVWHAEFSPDGQQIVTASDDKQACIWNATSGRLIHELRHDDWVPSARFSPNGRRVVTASADHTARVWDAATGKLVSVLKHASALRWAEFSPDGRFVATASLDNTARLWDAVSGAPASEPLDHGGEVSMIYFSPDAALLATTGVNSVVRLWHVATGKPAADGLKHDDAVWHAQLSPDGRWLATGSRDGMMRIWEIPRAAAAAPTWLAGLAESVGGQWLDDFNNLQAVPTGLFHRIKDQLQDNGTENSTHPWVRWFLAERLERTISPSAPLKINDFVRTRIQDNQGPSLIEALHFSPTNALALSKLARWLLKQDPTKYPHGRADAERYLDWACHWCPETLEAWWGRAEWFAKSGDDTRAAEAMASASKLESRPPEFETAHGEVLERLNRLADAENAYSRAISLAMPRSRAQIDALIHRWKLRRELGRMAEAQADFLAARNIPARDPQAGPNLIDLSPYYNAALDEHWHNPKNLGAWSLGLLPDGQQVFGDVAFDVRGAVQLTGRNSPQAKGQYPASVEGIQVRRRCRVVHFLDANVRDKKVPAGTEIGSYVIHYADGQTAVLPLIHGEDSIEGQIRDNGVSQFSNCTIVRSRKTPSGGDVLLLKRTWENPRPDIEIARIDFGSKLTPVGPLLIALTAEP